MKKKYFYIIFTYFIFNIYSFSSIIIENDSFPPLEVRSLLSSYEEKELTEDEIDNLRRELTNLYIKHGYITSFVKLKEYKSVSKEIIFKVEYGKIGEIISDSSNYFALPTYSEKIFNIRDIDQFVENTQTQLTKVDVKIIPSKKESHSDILIKKERKKQIYGRISLDNFNYKDQGRENICLFLYRDSLFFSGDGLQFFSKERLVKKRKDNRESLYRFSYFLPIGYSKIQYNFSLKRNFNKVFDKKYSTKKIEYIHNFQFSRNLFRDSKNKSEFYLIFDLRDTKNYLDNIKLDVSSKRYSSLSLGLRNTHFLENSYLFYDLNIEKAVPWFHSETNKENENVVAPFDKEFKKYNFSLEFSKNFFYMKYGYLNYNFNLYSSYSKSHLLDDNKFEMGGIDSVRGFKESTIKGDKGLYIQNTLIFKTKRSFNPFIGFDMGISRDRYRKNSDYISGVALGVQFQKENLSAEITFSKSVKRALDMPKESPPIYFKISYTF